MFELENHHRNVPDKELLDDLAGVASRLKKRAVTIDEYNVAGRFHATTLTRRFGSWFVALEKAGLEKTRNLNIPNENLFENLARIWTEIGHQPKYKDLTKPLSQYSSGTYEKRFGSWRNGLEAFVAWANEGRMPAPPRSKAKRLGRRTPRQVNWRLRALVLMRDGARCRMCGASPQDGVKLHVDHIIAWNNGGETELDNLQILCDRCNIGKSDLEVRSNTNV